MLAIRCLNHRQGCIHDLGQGEMEIPKILGGGVQYGNINVQRAAGVCVCMEGNR